MPIGVTPDPPARPDTLATAGQSLLMGPALPAGPQVGLPVDEMAKDLRPHEAYMARQFHAALVAALQHVIWYAEDVDDDVKVGGTAFRPVAYGVGDIAAPEWWTSDAEPEYNATMQLRTCSENYLSQVLMSSAGAPELGESERFELLDVFQSFYQKLTFWESREEDPEERDVFMKIE